MKSIEALLGPANTLTKGLLGATTVAGAAIIGTAGEAGRRVVDATLIAATVLRWGLEADDTPPEQIVSNIRTDETVIAVGDMPDDPFLTAGDNDTFLAPGALRPVDLIKGRVFILHATDGPKPGFDGFIIGEEEPLQGDRIEPQSVNLMS
jgi:hypothetical protein